jgi:putative NIF3 family GTP cyclohydrolase 1 type 2
MKDSTKKLSGTNPQSRRHFITGIATIAGGQALLSIPLVSKAIPFTAAFETYTVAQVMDKFISEVPGGREINTVDTLKSGSADSQITGIVTTMFATIEVIRKTISLGANFIIAHEPTFYNHEDEVAWLKDNQVYQYKADLLKQHNITVWRNHNYIHNMLPDPVTMALLAQLVWTQYADKGEKGLSSLVNIPALSLKDLIEYLKQKLGVNKVRYIGDPLQSCSSLLLVPGAAGRFKQVGGAALYHPDVLICGELQEWETAEYVRDARTKGENLALIIMGHIASEEAGSEFMLNWLKEKFPSIKSVHIPAGNSLSFL